MLPTLCPAAAAALSLIACTPVAPCPSLVLCCGGRSAQRTLTVRTAVHANGPKVSHSAAVLYGIVSVWDGNEGTVIQTYAEFLQLDRGLFQRPNPTATAFGAAAFDPCPLSLVAPKHAAVASCPSVTSAAVHGVLRPSAVQPTALAETPQ